MATIDSPLPGPAAHGGHWRGPALLAAIMALALAGYTGLNRAGPPATRAVEASSARVNSAVLHLWSPGSGVLETRRPSGMVEGGEVLGAVRQPDGTSLPLVSPCHCRIEDWAIPSGAGIAADEPIVTLTVVDRQTTVRATLPARAAAGIHAGIAADLFVPGQDLPRPGRVVRILRPATTGEPGDHRADPTGGAVDILVAPAFPLPASSLGQQLRVRFLL